MLSILKLFFIFISAFAFVYFLMFISRLLSRIIEKVFFKRTKNQDSTDDSFSRAQENNEQDVIEITDYEIKNNNSNDDMSH